MRVREERVECGRRKGRAAGEGARKGQRVRKAEWIHKDETDLDLFRGDRPARVRSFALVARRRVDAGVRDRGGRARCRFRRTRSTVARPSAMSADPLERLVRVGLWWTAGELVGVHVTRQMLPVFALVAADQALAVVLWGWKVRGREQAMAGE